jgi:hypothetical protein
MHRNPVKSSNISSIGYDPVTCTLQVEFRNGGLFNYDGVTPDQHAEMMKADSIGRYFHAHVRNGCRCSKVKQEQAE